MNTISVVGRMFRRYVEFFFCSPILFALYLADWGMKLELSREGFKIGNLIVSGLLFADDLLVGGGTNL